VLEIQADVVDPRAGLCTGCDEVCSDLGDRFILNAENVATRLMDAMVTA